MRRSFWVMVLLGAASVLPSALRAQSTCSSGQASSLTASATWPAALRRTVTLHLREATLRDVLEEISHRAHVRLSYSADLIPLYRRVCVSWDSVTVGAALGQLLDGTAAQAVAAADDHVVLAPGRPRPALARASVSHPLLFPLAPVHVRADAAPAARGPLPVDVEVIEGEALRDAGGPTLRSALNVAVPGFWVWPDATGFLANYGSIRGASSFGLSAPRIYIDGIEIANPLLLTRLSPDIIERIEVMRGPQAAAFFGVSGMSGITNIVTRHERAEGGAPRFGLRSTLGLAATNFAPQSALDHEHSMRMSLGSSARSAMVSLSLGGEGGSIPGADNRHVSADASLRLVGARTLLTGTLRFLAQQAGAPVSPLLPDAQPVSMPRNPGGPAFPVDTSASRLSVRQFTAGLRALFTPNDVWTHSLVVGLDGYTLAGADGNTRLLSSAVDSALREAGSQALRGTLRWNSQARLLVGAHATGSLMLSADHTRFREYDDAETLIAGAIAPRRPVALMQPGGTEPRINTPAASQILTSAQNTTGFGAQGSVSLFDRMTLNAGLRMERNEGRIGLGEYAVLPMLGGTMTAAAGDARIKLRAAWAKGVRWPDVPRSVSSWMGHHPYVLIPSLGPEQQSGIEAGFDLTLGRAFSLQVTHFDQTASGLIQQVAVSAIDAGTEPWQKPRTISVPQNVGEVANRGWETQATLARGALLVSAAVSWVDSHVIDLAAGYRGDLLPGDRMLAVPSRTLGLNAQWTGAGWAASTSVQRAYNWVNYDRIALARAVIEPDPSGPPMGTGLRDFWRTYNGNTQLGVSFRRNLPRGLVLLVSGQNLLNYQLGEPDNITVSPGRTFSLGIRATF